ncbi:MAG TPA: hypothetical protein DD426_12695 [Clostridiaceae bacterium]|nr:hypothetical protein [Clostridiaceae bacterium]
MNNIDIISELADLKEIDYKNTLAIVSIIELLIEKKIITRTDISKKSQFLDNLSVNQLKLLKSKSDKY